MLILVEENHSLHEMRTKMPLLNRLAKKYAVATNYKAITYPSLPNYLAIAGGSTFRVIDDANPSAHLIRRRSIFDQALKAGKTAQTYAESMPSNCYVRNRGHAASGYAVRHNPWTYFVDHRSDCKAFDVPLGSAVRGAFHHDIQDAALPNVGLVVPNLCNDAHSCPLAVANTWLATWMPQVLTGRDFTSGRLTVIITADSDDQSAGNKVATVVMHSGMKHRRVTKPMNHYSLTGYVDHVLGVPLLRHAKRGFGVAFGL